MSGDRLILLSMWALVAVAMLALIYWTIRSGNGFSLLDFVSGPDGRGDPQRAAYTGAFLISTWLMWMLASAGSMTEGYLALYLGAFITGGVVKAWAPRRPPPRDDDGQDNGRRFER